jgi:hypothetical protein
MPQIYRISFLILFFWNGATPVMQAQKKEVSLLQRTVLKGVVGINYNVLDSELKIPPFLSGFYDPEEKTSNGFGASIGLELETMVLQNFSVGAGAVLRQKRGALKNHEYNTWGWRRISGFPQGIPVNLSEITSELHFHYLRLEIPIWVKLNFFPNKRFFIEGGGTISPVLLNYSREKGEERIFNRLTNGINLNTWEVNSYVEPVEPNEYIYHDREIPISTRKPQFGAFAGAGVGFESFGNLNMELRLRYARYFSKPIYEREIRRYIAFLSITNIHFIEISLATTIIDFQKSIAEKQRQE